MALRALLSHTDQYVTTNAQTPRLAAHDYLGRYGHLLGLRHEHLKNLSRSPEHEPTATGVEYRYLSEKHQFDMSTVSFHQTCFGLPVWEAGLSVTMKHNPLRVVGARSTQHPKLAVKRPNAMHITRLKALDVKTLAKHLGLDGKAHRGALSINRQRLMIYQHDETRLRHATARPSETGSGILSGRPTLPLPAGPFLDPGRQALCRQRRLLRFRLPADSAVALGCADRGRDIVGAATAPLHRQCHRFGVRGRSGDTCRRSETEGGQRGAQPVAQHGNASRSRSARERHPGLAR